MVRSSRSKSKSPCKKSKGRCSGKAKTSNKKGSSKRSVRRTRSKRGRSNRNKSMKGGVFYSFNSKDVVGGLPAVVRHTDDCPVATPQSSNFGSAIYGLAKAQNGGACGCGKIASGGSRKRRSSKKASSKKSSKGRSKGRSNGSSKGRSKGRGKGRSNGRGKGSKKGHSKKNGSRC